MILSLHEKIIDILEHQSDAAAVEDALLNAAFLFEKVRGVPPCAWPEEVLTADPTPEDMHHLQSAVVEHVERTGFGTWTLGKCCDPSLKPVLVAILRLQVDGNAAELFQAMIALANIGEPVFGTLCSHSILDEEQNRELARKYLSRG